jgi:hypothetical protein
MTNESIYAKYREADREYKKVKEEFTEELEQKIRQDAKADGIKYIELLGLYQEAIEELRTKEVARVVMG